MDDRDVGRELRRMRLERGLTQADCADRVGLTPNAWSKIECGVRGLGMYHLRSVSDALDVSYVDVLRMFGPVVRHDDGPSRDDDAMRSILSEYVGDGESIGPVMEELRRLRRARNEKEEKPS